MPRESVRTTAGSPFDVQVGWGPRMEGYTQVGVTVSDGRSLLWLLYGDLTEQLGSQTVELLERLTLESSTMAGIGEAILNLLDVLCHDGTSDTPRYNGLWADLDRNGINELIRLLRKSRDHAFGRDE